MADDKTVLETVLLFRQGRLPFEVAAETLGINLEEFQIAVDFIERMETTHYRLKADIEEMETILQNRMSTSASAREILVNLLITAEDAEATLNEYIKNRQSIILELGAIDYENIPDNDEN